MNSLLIFLLKSTLALSLLYLFFRLLLRNETYFRISRSVLLFIVFASIVIPFIYLPQVNHPIVSVRLDPIFQGNTIIEKPVQTEEATSETALSTTNLNAFQPIVISTKSIFLFIYLTGVFISLLLFVYSIFSVLRLFRKSRKTTVEGMQVLVHDTDIPAFSFRRRILISRHDYDTNAEAILTHELSHIRQGHFYDLMLIEIVKIIYWFNPLVYLISSDLKDIHEFQADENTINSGVDPSEYQLLIIQKCVGQQSFALANSFNHCQIKKRITMMNKSKTSKAWCWKVATFLPLLALLLMAFGRRGEIVPEKTNLPERVMAPAVIATTQNQLTNQVIEIRKDGNFIDNKLCSLEEIVKKAQEWKNASNVWIPLLIDESIPFNRIDEVREALADAKVYHVTQTTVGSDDVVYFMGDVSESAKFSQGKWDEWISNQLKKFPEAKTPAGDYLISYSFIIDKNGKARDGHLIKKSDYPEVNAAYEKILAQIPNWEPAKRGADRVSVYFKMMSGLVVYSPPKKVE
jgi:beta-lactamase regulating signal transducer with metallopeptidase domain